MIKNTSNLDLNIFIVRYAVIFEKLVKSGALFSLDRAVRLINNLPEKLREQIIDLCTKKNWKLSVNDIEINISNFDKIKQFIFFKVHFAQKWVVLDQERDIIKTFISISFLSESQSKFFKNYSSILMIKDLMKNMIQWISHLTLIMKININNINCL